MVTILNGTNLLFTNCLPFFCWFLSIFKHFKCNEVEMFFIILLILAVNCAKYYY